MRPTAFLLLAVFLAIPSSLSAQYFGQNKVRYESFDFKVLKTEHFDIHYYDEEKDAVAEVARMAERWYARLSKLLDHQLTLRQPVIIYASAPAFRGTTAISGYIGETTGGVTEGVRRRLVIPLAGPMAETDHVLGHELVHAFQFDIASRVNSEAGGGLSGALQLPLWFVEGMAEYLSLGQTDPQTSMWLRDAVRREDVPPIKKLDNPRYFPYRYGQAFWAFIGGRYGDEAIGKILKMAARSGAEAAITRITGLTSDAVSAEWRNELSQAYQPILRLTQTPQANAKKIAGSLEDDSGSSLNVAPILSPDGRRMVFFSAKDLFSVELFMADAQTGQILHKLTKTDVDPHFDSLEFVSSAGAWSDDGTRFAFPGVSGGRPEITVYNVDQGTAESRTDLRALGEVLNLTWSPDGKQIAFSAISHGVTDLFVLDRETGQTRQVTNDEYADLQPAWSPDGRRIAFVTDRFTSDTSDLSFGAYRVGLIDPDGGNVVAVRSFDTGKQTNPQWSRDGASLYFISDRDGISNIYRVPARGGTADQITDLQTGVSGITSLSPAFSVASRDDALVFTAFGNGNYAIYRLDGDALAGSPASTALSNLNAGVLPPASRSEAAGEQVGLLLKNPDLGLEPANFKYEPYHPKLGLDYIATPQLGVGIGNFGSFIGGGTAFSFSDLLGYHNLTTVVQTSITSEGGNFLNSLSAVGIYQNQRRRWNWGVTGGQVPLITGGFSQSIANVGGEPALVNQELRLWQIDRELMGTISYPFNRAQRLEFSGGYQNISFKAQSETTAVSLASGELIVDETEDLPASESLRLGRTGAALVYDTSVFGGTSPVAGQSYRLEYGLSAGTLTFSTFLVDYRKYLHIGSHFTLAGRILHYGRYGSGGEDPRQQDLFLGYPELVRGYNADSFTIDECGPAASQTGSCPVFDRLLGSRLAVANAEARVPLLGFLGVIPSRSLPPVEAALFYDAGVAWRSTDKANFLGGSRQPVKSYGTSLRFNILGFAIGQLSYVKPIDRPRDQWHWEFSFIPGF